MNKEKSIPLFKVFLAPEEDLMPRLREILYSGQISEGFAVVDFEKQFSKFIGCESLLSFYSGTAALHTALILAGVKEGDSVISTAMTAEPTNMAISHARAKIIWGDVDPLNGNLTGNSIEEILNKNSKIVKAIMVVHYGGIPAPIQSIRDVAEKYNVPVIEDAAHALGARYAGKHIGAHSEYTMFSLQAIKHMTTVDGGMLVCKQASDLPLGRKIRWFGIDRLAPRTSVDVDVVGYKYHMNNVTATIGLVQLEHISPILQKHIENGKFFDNSLIGIPGLQRCVWDALAEPSYWFYTVLVEKRDDFSRYMTECGIGNSQAHKRNDQHTIFKSSQKNLPGLDSFYSKMIHIPCGWWIESEEREYIVDCIRKGW
jgi:dTDP-4-amino-4,6-dideoxygalactose transaminase